jgi:ubiquinone/menaquinone biosynthesis C-methylase UbiE
MNPQKPQVDSLSGYNRIAKDYDLGRPDYPAEAIRFFIQALDLPAEAQVLDLAAGTGKLTKALLDYGFHLKAVEPVEEMREFFARAFPTVPIFNGTAEHIPFSDVSLDAIVVGTAFHWFDTEKALNEMGRVLKPHGKLGLIWNIFDGPDDWVQKIRKLIEPGVDLKKCWQQSYLEHPLFQTLGHHTINYCISGKESDVMNRIHSAKIMGILKAADQRKLIQQAKQILASDPRTSQSVFDIPYRIEINWAVRSK